MFNINNKNLISFSFELIVIFALAIIVSPRNTNANQFNCEISNYNISSSFISPGGSAILNWNTNNCNSVNISNIGSVSGSGSRVVYPMSTTTYVLNAHGSNGMSVYQTKTVTVQRLNCEIPNFNVSSSYVNPGGSTMINWDTNNCNSVNITNIGNVNTSGNQTISPIATTTYILTAYGSNGEAVTKSKTVTVQQLNCEIYNFNISPNYIVSGQSATLNWSTNNCNSVNISNVGSVNVTGSQIVYPKYTTTYILTAYSSNGMSIYQTKTINVSIPPVVKSTTSSTNNTSKTSNTTSTTTKNTNATSNTNQSNNGDNTDNGNQVSNLAGNALFGSSGFLPSSLFGWLFFAILILIAIILWRKLYISDKEKETPLKHA